MARWDNSISRRSRPALFFRPQSAERCRPGERTMRRPALLRDSIAIGFGLGPGPAAAATWPTRPMTMVVPVAAGGTADPIARVLAAGLSQQLGQQGIVENVGGARGMAGTQHL